MPAYGRLSVLTCFYQLTPMNEAQALQARRMPNWQPGEIKIVDMTFVIDDPKLSSLESIKCIKTLAASLDEAVKRAKRKYGPGHLNAWGAHSLPLDRWLLGGGCLVRSKHDKSHAQDLYWMGY